MSEVNVNHNELDERLPFSVLERFLSEVEMPEVSANLWSQFQQAVPNIQSEATIHFGRRGVSSRPYILTWEFRQNIWTGRGVELHGFSETLENLRKVEVARAISIDTDRYWALFFFDQTDKRVLGFLYFVRLDRQEQ